MARKRYAAGGGTWRSMNKVLPGAYINFASKERAMGFETARGTVAMSLELDWGDSENIITLDAKELQTEALQILGYNFVDEELKALREVFRGAKEVKLFRLNGKGSKHAAATVGGLKVKAKYPGIKGNDIKIVVQNTIDNEDTFEVVTYLNEIEQDSQAVTSIEELIDNAFVTFNGDGDLEVSAGINLEDGINGEVSGQSYADFLDAIEREDFTTILYAGEDEETKMLFEAFTNRLRDEEGYKITTVLFDYAKADYEGIFSIKNAGEAVYWFAGHAAGADYNESLTNKLYNGEYDFNAKYKQRELIEFTEQGHVVFYQDGDDKRVLNDINTFTSFVPRKNKDYSNGRVIRTLDQIALDTAIIFNKIYMGNVDNEEIGRDLFKNELVDDRRKKQSKRAITNFDYDDIEVFKGPEKGDVGVNEAIEPVGAMEKLYHSIAVI